MNLTKIKTGVYVCHCGTNIASVVDVAAVADFAAGLEGVTVARDYTYMCSDPGQDLIKNDIQEYGLNPFFFQMANIREHCSWVIDDRQLATNKAKSMVAAAVRRVHYHDPLEMRQVKMTPAALVLGGGIAGMEAALRLADAGKHVYLVEREPSIGGHMAQLYKTFPTLDCAA